MRTGRQLPHNWSTISNEAAFGTDYFTRTAVAKSNIFVNSPNETKYFYQDLDETGERLNSANRYVVTFAKDQTPPVNRSRSTCSQRRQGTRFNGRIGFQRRKATSRSTYVPTGRGRQ